MMSFSLVSERAVEQRVRRALAQEGELLRKTRPGNTWAKADLGDFYTIDAENRLVRRHCCLEELAHECGVMRPAEVINTL